MKMLGWAGLGWVLSTQVSGALCLLLYLL